MNCAITPFGRSTTWKKATNYNKHPQSLSFSAIISEFTLFKRFRWVLCESAEKTYIKAARYDSTDIFQRKLRELEEKALKKMRTTYSRYYQVCLHKHLWRGLLPTNIRSVNVYIRGKCGSVIPVISGLSLSVKTFTEDMNYTHTL